MAHPMKMFTQLPILFKRRLHWYALSNLGGLVLALLSTNLLAAPAAPGSAENGTSSLLLISLLAAVVLTVLIIVGLVHWGRKQEVIVEMMHLCMRHLINSIDVNERCGAARALGRLNDDSAFLVLLDTILDEDEIEEVREVCREALNDMCGRNRRYLKILADYEFETEMENFQGMIDMLLDNFESDSKKHVQSAFIIGRLFMQMHQYEQAHEWLNIAESRSTSFRIYGNRISELINLSHVGLLADADYAFNKADYHKAKAIYAILDHELEEADRQRFKMYLRQACVYCKLRDYGNADQSLLQALNHHHGTDQALTLVPLLQKISAPGGESGSEEKTKELQSKIDSKADEIMGSLMEDDLLSR